MSRPRISGRRTWGNHERRVLGIFELALEMLRLEKDLDVSENKLNRRLFFCIRSANAKLAEVGEDVGWPIIYEGHNQPDPDDAEKAARENKIPDYQWGFTDPTEPDSLRRDKLFVVECKRLGKPVRRDWVFNENYVKKGVLRFVRAGHGYGKSASSGAMVGYVRSMSLKKILQEVNGHAAAEPVSEITLSKQGWVEKGVSRLEHELDRPEVPPTPFTLQHLWVDFRKD